MDLSFMQNELVLALCWTLIHSLWQGLLLAIVTGVVMISTRKSNARKRYRALTAIFFVFILVAVVTFVRELNLVNGNNTGTAVAIGNIGNQPAANLVYPVDTSVGEGSGSFLERFKDYFNTHASLIVMIWFIIFIARLIKLTADLAYVQRLKHYKTHQPAEEWTDTINELILKLGINKKIRLLESAIVKVPVVMGVLKPVILLPVGLLANLPADEVEAILLHELAHIQRKDYGMNLLQSFAETVFFFNPALMWLSSMIREERENCCDDIAISVTNNKTKFINALISFQEYNFSTSKYAMGFPGKKNHLLNRVKRIVSDRNKTLNATEKSILSFGMCLLIMFSFVAAKKITPVEVKPVETKHIIVSTKPALSHMPVVNVPKTKDTSTKEVNVYNTSGELIALMSTITADTVPTAKKAEDDEAAAVLRSKSARVVADTIIKENIFTSFTTSFTSDGKSSVMVFLAKKKDGKTYRLKKENEVVTEFAINDELIPQSQWEAHRDEMDLVENTYRGKQLDNKRRKLAKDEEHRLTVERDHLLQEKKRAIVEERAAVERDKRVIEKIKRDAGKRISEEQKVLLLEKYKEALLHKQQENMLHEEKIKLLKKYPDTLMWIKQKENEKVKWQKLEMKKDSVKSSIISRERDEAVKRKLDQIRVREERDAVRFEESATTMRSIVADLEKEGIKVDLQKSWFALDKDQFLVDGKKMSTEQHNKFITKYIKPNNNGWGYYYGPIQTRGRGVFLDYRDLVK